jgi:hypothetical protein
MFRQTTCSVLGKMKRDDDCRVDHSPCADPRVSAIRAPRTPIGFGADRGLYNCIDEEHAKEIADELAERLYCQRNRFKAWENKGLQPVLFPRLDVLLLFRQARNKFLLVLF